jgi:hypothetical protein
VAVERLAELPGPELRAAIAAQHKAERKASRPVCSDCGTRFTDER